MVSPDGEVLSVAFSHGVLQFEWDGSRYVHRGEALAGGRRVAMSEDGSILAVGRPFDMSLEFVREVNFPGPSIGRPDLRSGNHLGVEVSLGGEQPIKIAIMSIRVPHHRCNRKQLIEIRRATAVATFIEIAIAILGIHSPLNSFSALRH